jgi:hypothetical protein
MSTTPTDDVSVKGSCLCGQVSFELTEKLRQVVYCHCQQCRKTSGHFVAATAVSTEHLVMTNDAGLSWYRSSDDAERGFCKECGSSLFWRPEQGDYVSVWAGSLESPTGISGSKHIFVADAGDYYDLHDDLPKHAQYCDDLWTY